MILNSHRTGAAWTLRTVAAILANPRYTGRQVWNRQSVDHHENDPGDKTSRTPGRRPTHGWNTKDQWIISTNVAHPPLISETDFIRAQQITAITQPDDGNPHRYQLTGLVICGLCGRRAEGHWAHGRARYRCRHGNTSGRDATLNRFPTLYVREDQVLAQAVAQLGDARPDDDVAALMRARRITIVCTTVSVSGATAMTAAEPAREKFTRAGFFALRPVRSTNRQGHTCWMIGPCRTSGRRFR